MSFDLEMGFVGSKEKFIAKRYIESEYKEQEINTCLWVEKKHQNGVRGQFFNNISDLVDDDNCSSYMYTSLNDYIDSDCGYNGGIDDLIYSNVDEDKEKEDFTGDEIIEIVKKFDDDEIVKGLLNLKENEELHIINDCTNGNYIGTDEEQLILDYIADGQYQRVYNNIEEILEAIESDEELATVYIYNYMSNYEKDKFAEEFENEN
jgi:hypothetical protein